MNIAEAIKAEEAYINNRLNGVEARPMVDIVADYGFDSLASYHEQKSLYLFEHAEYTEVHTTDEKAFEDISKILIAEKPTLLFEKHDEPFIYLGSKEYDAAAVKASGIKAYDGGYLGGTIVGGTGDLSVGIFYSSLIDIRADYILDRIAEILQKHGINAVKDNNDILVNGKKVAGTACLETNSFYGFVAYLSFSNNAEIVKQICGESEKKPGFIDGITADEFMEEMRQWLL